MTTTPLHLTTISFPEIRLPQRAAAHLRGFFGNYFREHSVLLHNHYEDGSSRHRMPLVQYKVIRGTPTLVGIQDGAQVLAELFFKMKSIRIEDRDYDLMERDISLRQTQVGVGDGLNNYQFVNPWMALNQENHQLYLSKDVGERKTMLEGILTANILSFYKGVGHQVSPEQRILSSLRIKKEKISGFKDQRMTTFVADFTTNAMIPDWVGLGKSVARGFGTIERF
jgi:Cas6b C-terminal domain/Cas6b N-terminal domain